MGALTILSSVDGNRLAKTISWKNGEWVKSDYDRAKFFSVYSTVAGSLAELSAILMEIEDIPTSCLIRGGLKPGHPTDNVRRLLRDDDETGSPAPFVEQAVDWVMLDIDGLPVSPDLTMPQRVAQLLYEMPQPFHDADFHIHWSSGAGLDGWNSLRAHLWFWLATPLRCSELRARAQAEAWDVDISLFNPVQVHYTANPIFDGVDDPLVGQRSHLVTRRQRRVILPPWAPPQPLAWTNLNMPLAPSLTFEERLATIGPRYHLPILQAAASYVATYKAEADLHGLKARLKDAIQLAAPGANPKRNYLNDRYLDDLIRGAVRKFGR